VSNQTLGQQVARRLMHDLNSGAFKQGDKLPTQIELMTRYSAGRNTVREAVQGLVALGLLDVRAGFGTIVCRIDGQAVMARTVSATNLDEVAMSDLLELRLLLEGEAAALASERAAVTDHDAIRAALADYQDAVRRAEEVYAHDVAFHRAIADATHNRLYVGVIDTSSQLFQKAMQAADRAPGDIFEAAAEHALIAHHILAGDGESARAAMRDHIVAGNNRRLRTNTNQEVAI
jgi:GntR family transcriptional regulator, transcriptional repressor for pyruvate dehydrogenase complex